MNDLPLSALTLLIFLGLSLGLSLIALVLLWRLSQRMGAPDPAGLAWQTEFDQKLTALTQRLEAVDRGLREDLHHQSSSTRSELVQSQQGLGAGLFQQLQAITEGNERRQEALRLTLDTRLEMLGQLTEKRLEQVRTLTEGRLDQMRQTLEARLEQMRQTVDEKLHATLEQRLGESFKLVAERLELVYTGLGEMRRLAADVGSLHRVLSNVKTRGIVGEVQLTAMLDQVLVPEQYALNVETVPHSGCRVEAAVKMPVRGGDAQNVQWLPIDAKFPREDYERLVDAQERADAPGVEQAAKALEQRLRGEARSIREKYISPPHTSDFAVLFLPTEGLYAEALRRPGLMESLLRDHRVMLAGPTTLLATLTSLQSAFRAVALEQRSQEVWEVLGEVKSEFNKFGEVLAKAQKQLSTVGKTLEQTQTRVRVMNRALRSVETMPVKKIGLWDSEDTAQLLDSDTWVPEGEDSAADGSSSDSALTPGQD